MKTRVENTSEEAPKTAVFLNGIWAGVRSLGLLCIVLPYFLVMATGVIVTSISGLRLTWGWWFARMFCRNVLRLSRVSFQASGLEHIPKTGGFVLVANHQSHFDG